MEPPFRAVRVRWAALSALFLIAFGSSGVLAAPFEFRGGDRVVFLGDSITQHGQYPLYLECFLLEQFPDSQLTFRNAGWGSDRAWLHQRTQGTDLNGDAMLKLTGDEQEKIRAGMVAHGLARDVLSLKPTVVTIMFGTNDAHDGDLALALHLRSLEQIIAQLRDANCRVILLSAPPEELGSPFNAEHEKFVAAVRSLSERKKVPFVDVFHPVLQAVQQAKQTDPGFSYTRDGFHPHPSGHAMIARAIVSGLGFDAARLNPESPLLAKVTEKYREYFRRWREVQIPALLSEKLDSAETRTQLAEADNQIARLEAEIDKLRSAPPLVVGNRVCFFLDDRFISEQAGLKRTWHQGKPREEVAIRATQPWEKWPHLFGSVFRDPKDGLFKMYYESAIFPALRPPDSFTCYICYAESRDGKNWIKPKLGLYEHAGSKENNIVFFEAELANIILDPRERDPAARLKAFVYLKSHNPHGGHGTCLLSSGDGLKWKFLGGFNKPEYVVAEQGNFTDSHSFIWDPLGQRYLAFVRTFVKSHVAESKDGRRRAVGISQCQELNRGWTPIINVLAADERDDAKVAPFSKDPNKPDWAELYVMNFFPYGNQYIGLVSLLYLVDGADSNGGGDLQLTFSHDGLKWFRQPERATLIAPSNAKELFPTYITTNEPLEIGDELWLYYTEANGGHPIAPFEKAVSQIRAAVWRKDGFVSMDAAAKGSLKTHPFIVAGKQLRVNYEGTLTVTLLDEQGQPLSGFSPKSLKGDAVSVSVDWDLSALSGKPIRLRFDLENGRLWSFRFAP